MIDESVMDKIIPIPEEEKEILKIQKELVEKGFIINNFNKGGVFYHLIRISVQVLLDGNRNLDAYRYEEEIL